MSTIRARLTSSDAEVRARTAAELTAAAAALADVARAIRDDNAAEMLRKGVRPVDVGRVIGLTRAQMARWNRRTVTKRLTAAGNEGRADAVDAAIAKLTEVLVLDPAPA